MAGNWEEMAVPELAKLGSKAKAAFTRAVTDLDQKLQHYFRKRGQEDAAEMEAEQGDTQKCIRSKNEGVRGGEGVCGSS